MCKLELANSRWFYILTPQTDLNFENFIICLSYFLPIRDSSVCLWWFYITKCSKNLEYLMIISRNQHWLVEHLRSSHSLANANLYTVECIFCIYRSRVYEQALISWNKEISSTVGFHKYATYNSQKRIILKLRSKSNTHSI